MLRRNFAIMQVRMYALTVANASGTGACGITARAGDDVIHLSRCDGGVLPLTYKRTYFNGPATAMFKIYYEKKGTYQVRGHCPHALWARHVHIWLK